MRPPEGASNVLRALDDAAFGNLATFGGSVETSNLTRMPEGGPGTTVFT